MVTPEPSQRVCGGDWNSGQLARLNVVMSEGEARTVVQGGAGVRAHPLVSADAGRIALMRGPMVYCLESADNGDQVRSFAVHTQGPFSAEHVPDLLGGVTVIKGRALALAPERWDSVLYRAVTDTSGQRPADFTAIPYYANANRGPVHMTTWIPVSL